jgi:hypothetical protein
MKRAAKLATVAELAELGHAYVILGEGLAVPLTVLSPGEWEAKYGGERLTMYTERWDGASHETATRASDSTSE